MINANKLFPNPSPNLSYSNGPASGTKAPPADLTTVVAASAEAAESAKKSTTYICRESFYFVSIIAELPFEKKLTCTSVMPTPTKFRPSSGTTQDRWLCTLHPYEERPTAIKGSPSKVAGSLNSGSNFP